MTYSVGMNPYLNNQQTGYASSLGLSSGQGYSDPINMLSGSSSAMGSSMDPYAMYLQQTGTYDALASAYPTTANPYASQGAVVSSASPSFGGGESYQDPYSMMDADYYSYEPDPSTNGFLVFLGLAGHVWQKWNYLAGPDAIDNTKFENTYEHNKKFNGIPEIESATPKSVLDGLDSNKVTSEDFTRLLKELEAAKTEASTNLAEVENKINKNTTPATSLVYGSDFATNKQLAEIELNRYLADMQESLMVSKAGSADIKAALKELNALRSGLYSQLNTIQNNTDLETFTKNLVNAQTTSKYLATSEMKAPHLQNLHNLHTLNSTPANWRSANDVHYVLIDSTRFNNWKQALFSEPSASPSGLFQKSDWDKASKRPDLTNAIVDTLTGKSPTPEIVSGNSAGWNTAMNHLRSLLTNDFGLAPATLSTMPEEQLNTLVQKLVDANFEAKRSLPQAITSAPGSVGVEVMDRYTLLGIPQADYNTLKQITPQPLESRGLNPSIDFSTVAKKDWSSLNLSKSYSLFSKAPTATAGGPQIPMNAIEAKATTYATEAEAKWAADEIYRIIRGASPADQNSPISSEKLNQILDSISPAAKDKVKDKFSLTTLDKLQISTDSHANDRVLRLMLNYQDNAAQQAIVLRDRMLQPGFKLTKDIKAVIAELGLENSVVEDQLKDGLFMLSAAESSRKLAVWAEDTEHRNSLHKIVDALPEKVQNDIKQKLVISNLDNDIIQQKLPLIQQILTDNAADYNKVIGLVDSDGTPIKVKMPPAQDPPATVKLGEKYDTQRLNTSQFFADAARETVYSTLLEREYMVAKRNNTFDGSFTEYLAQQAGKDYIKTSPSLARVESQDLTKRWQTVIAAEKTYQESFATAPADYDKTTSWQFDEMTDSTRNKLSATDRALIAQRTNTSSMQDDYEKYTKVNEKLNSLTGGTSDLLNGDSLKDTTQLHLTTHPAADLDNARLLANYYSFEEPVQQQIRTILGVSSAEMPDLVMKAQDSVQEAIQQTALEHKDLATKLQQTALPFKSVAVDASSKLREFNISDLDTTLQTMNEVQTAKANTGKKVSLINAILNLETSRKDLVDAAEKAQTAWENYKKDTSISTPKTWANFLATDYAKNAGIDALKASATRLDQALNSEADFSTLKTFGKADTSPLPTYSAANVKDTDFNSLKAIRGKEVEAACSYAKLSALKDNFTTAYTNWTAKATQENRTTLELAATQLKTELNTLGVNHADDLVDYSKGTPAINDFYEHHKEQTKWQAYIQALDAFDKADDADKDTKLTELNKTRKAVGINDELKYDPTTTALTASSDGKTVKVSDLTTQAQADLKISRNFVQMDSFEKVENARKVLKDTFDITDVTQQNEILSKIAENKQSLATILIEEGLYTQNVYELAMKELAITNADFTTNRLETEKARWQMLDEAAQTKGTTRQIAAAYFTTHPTSELASLVQKAEDGDAMAQKLLRQGLKQGHITTADITTNRTKPLTPLTPLTLKGLSLTQQESFTYLFDFNETFKKYLVEDKKHKLSLNPSVLVYNESTAKKGDTIAFKGEDSKWHVGTLTQDPSSSRLVGTFIRTSVDMPKGRGADFEFTSHKDSLDSTLTKLNAIRQMLLDHGVPATQLGDVITDLANAAKANVDFTSANSKNWNDIIQKHLVQIRQFTDVDAINNAISDSATLQAPEKRTIIIDGKEVKITLMPGMSEETIKAALQPALPTTAPPAKVDEFIMDYKEYLKKSRGFVGQSDSLADAQKLAKDKKQKYTYMGQTIELDLSHITDVSQLSQNELDTAIKTSLAATGGDFVIDGKQFHIAAGSKVEDIAKLMTQMQETAKNVTEENYLKQIGIVFKDESDNRTLDFEGWKKQAVDNGSVVYYTADDGSIKKVETFADLQKAINNAKEVANKKYEEKLKTMSSTTATQDELKELATLKQAAEAAEQKWQEANQLLDATDEAKINFVKEQLAAESKTKTTPQTTGASTEIEEVPPSKTGVSPMNSLLQEIDGLRKQLQALEKTEGADQDCIKALRESLAEKSAEFEKQKGEYRSALATAMSQGDNAKELDGILRKAFEGKSISSQEDAFAIVKNLQANSNLANNPTGKALLSLMECDQDFFNEIKNKAVAGGADIISASLKKGSTSFVAPKTFGANFSKEIAVDLQNKGDWAVTGVQAVGSIALAAYNEYQATGQVGEATADAAVVGTAEAVGAKLGGDGAGSLVRAGLAAAGKSGNGWAMVLSAGATILGGFLGTKLLGGIAKEAVKD